MAETVGKLGCGQNTTSPADSNSDTAAQWDVQLYRCITAATRHQHPLHVLPSFYAPSDDSLRIYSPGYESGLPALSLHHSRNRHRLEAGKAHLVASLCGESCFLQRFLLRDGWVLFNGYALVEYPDGVDVVDARESKKLISQPPAGSRSGAGGAEADDEPPPFREVDVDPRLEIDESDRPSPQDRRILTWTGRKRVWKFLDARISPSTGEVWQAYVRRRRSDNGNTWTDGDERLPGDIIHTHDEPSDVDSVIVLIWEPS